MIHLMYSPVIRIRYMYLLNIHLSIRASAQGALCLHVFVLTDPIMLDLFALYRQPVDRLDNVSTTFRDIPVYK